MRNRSRTPWERSHQWRGCLKTIFSRWSRIRSQILQGINISSCFSYSQTIPFLYYTVYTSNLYYTQCGMRETCMIHSSIPSILVSRWRRSSPPPLRWCRRRTPYQNTIAHRAPTTMSWLCRLSSCSPAHIFGCRPPMVFWQGVGIYHRGVGIYLNPPKSYIWGSTGLHA